VPPQSLVKPVQMFIHAIKLAVDLCLETIEPGIDVRQQIFAPLPVEENPGKDGRN
jgi:hypothetical protein